MIFIKFWCVCHVNLKNGSGGVTKGPICVSSFSGMGSSKVINFSVLSGGRTNFTIGIELLFNFDIISFLKIIFKLSESS